MKINDAIERVARAIYTETPLAHMMPETFDGLSTFQRKPFLNMARAAIAAASEWQDISTAPKTGVTCLLWAAYENGGEAEQEFIGFYSPNIGWCIPAHMDNAPVPLAPTAWQPLPQPPTPKV